MEYRLKLDYEVFNRHKEELNVMENQKKRRRNVFIGLLALVGTVLSGVLMFRFLDPGFVGMSFMEELKAAGLAFVAYAFYLFLASAILLVGALYLFQKKTKKPEKVQGVRVRMAPETAQFQLSFEANGSKFESELKDLTDIRILDDSYVLVYKFYDGAQKDLRNYLSRRRRFARHAFLWAYLYRIMYYTLPFDKAEIEQYLELKEALHKIERDLHR